MKKLLSVLLVVVMLVTCISLFTSCTEENHNEKLLGKWGCHSLGKTIMYFFDKDEDGNYFAWCATSYNYGEPTMYKFDEYSASSKVITFKQEDGGTMKCNYSLEDGYLYIDGIEYEKID